MLVEGAGLRSVSLAHVSTERGPGAGSYRGVPERWARGLMGNGSEGEREATLTFHSRVANRS